MYKKEVGLVFLVLLNTDKIPATIIRVGYMERKR